MSIAPQPDDALALSQVNRPVTLRLIPQIEMDSGAYPRYQKLLQLNNDTIVNQ